MSEKASIQNFRADRRLGSPLHRQIYIVLRDRILSQRYSTGEMLPSEEEMVRMFKVSRSTLRYALSELEHDGLIERRHGVGTFVRHHAGTERLNGSISDMVTQKDKISQLTTVQVLEFSYEAAPRQVRELFGATSEALFQRAVRLRILAPDQPIMYITSYVPEELGRKFTAEDMERGTIFDLLTTAGARPQSAEQRVSAALADPLVASNLKVGVGFPLLQIVNMHNGEDGKLACYVEILANTTFFELRINLDKLMQ